MKKSFTKDASTKEFARNIVALYYKLFVFNAIFPYLLYKFGPYVGRTYDLTRTYTIFLYMTLAVIVFLALVTRARTSWGQVLIFADDLTIQKKDGTSLLIRRSTIHRTSISGDKVFSIAWKDNGKSKVCIIGKEGFASSTWDELLPFVRVWFPKN